MKLRNSMRCAWGGGVLAWFLAFGPPLWSSPTAAPDPGDPGAPDLDTLLARTISQVARDRELDEQFKSRYAFIRTKVTETRDGRGTLKKRSEERMIHPAPTEEGPRTETDPEEEEEDPGPSEAKRPYARYDFKVDPTLLKRFRFSYVGCETLEGRRAWVVDFEPISDPLPARSLKERFINLTAGRLWIDHEEAALAKAEFRLLGPVNVVGGLVGALKRCAVSLERQRTPQGFWYSRLLTWKIEGRKLFATRRMEHRDEVREVRPIFDSPPGGEVRSVPREVK